MMDFRVAKHLGLALLMLAPVQAACSKEGPDSLHGDALVQKVFTAVPDPECKTSLSEDFGILWSKSDAVSLFSSTGSKGSKFTVSSTEAGGKVATFSGLTTESSNGYFYALSPASDNARLVTTNGTVLAELPTQQTGVENSFAADANLSLARVKADAGSDSDILHFKNVGALLSFTVPGGYITRIRIESRDASVAMSGPANISYNDGKPTVSPTTSARNYVEVSVPQGSIGKTYYAVVYPGNYSQGFHVTFYASSNGFNRYTSEKPLDLQRNANVRLIQKNWGTNDDRPTNTESGTELIAPTIVSGGQVSPTSAKIQFSSSSGKRDTYNLYLRDAASMGRGTLVKSLFTGAQEYGQFFYTFSGLSTGASYDFGVSSACKDGSYSESSITWLEDVTINASVSNMAVTVESTAASYYNFVVDYSISGLTSTEAEHGLIFSYTNDTPTCGAVGEAGKLRGPKLNSTGSVSLSQCVPNACLRPGELCYVRAYCFDSDAGNYIYSPVQKLTLSAQPEGYSISKTAISSPSDAIALYSFKAGGTWNGYVAEADCSASSAIRLGVHNAPMGPASAISMASQLSASGALVLINGQIFGGQGNIGLAYTGGALRYNNSEDGTANACAYGNNSSPWQPVTRAILGVDANGKPGAYWCSLIGGTAFFFDRPTPAGTAVYPQVTANSGPGPKQSWSPQEALSTGPMLLYGGNVCVSEDKLKTGVYYTNYELWDTTSGSIYGSSRQRTAIGFNSASGRMYLVVVSSNCTITALARIMKGLGCDYAMNLDGGGSTQMQVSGTGALVSNSRNVKSTVGFFNR